MQSSATVSPLFVLRNASQEWQRLVEEHRPHDPRERRGIIAGVRNDAVLKDMEQVRKLETPKQRVAVARGVLGGRSPQRQQSHILPL